MARPAHANDGLLCVQARVLPVEIGIWCSFMDVIGKCVCQHCWDIIGIIHLITDYSGINYQCMDTITMVRTARNPYNSGNMPTYSGELHPK